MNDNLKAFATGFIQGVKETPRGFMAPVLALIRWLDRVTDEVISQDATCTDRSQTPSKRRR
jgi:hypothetical protein